MLKRNLLLIKVEKLAHEQQRRVLGWSTIVTLMMTLSAQILAVSAFRVAVRVAAMMIAALWTTWQTIKRRADLRLRQTISLQNLPRSHLRKIISVYPITFDHMMKLDRIHSKQLLLVASLMTKEVFCRQQNTATALHHHQLEGASNLSPTNTAL